MGAGFAATAVFTSSFAFLNAGPMVFVASVDGVSTGAGTTGFSGAVTSSVAGFMRDAVNFATTPPSTNAPPASNIVLGAAVMKAAVPISASPPIMPLSPRPSIKVFGVSDFFGGVSFCAKLRSFSPADFSGFFMAAP